ncbi:MAG: hypothetical protein M1816_004702 [Peltula sp. TS41687]|nr:MAG: hypothetical protein M1816_004702 [Peltula sp. TS41687]
MADPMLIATLIPVDDEKLTENAFRLKDNKARYLSPTREIEEAPPTISSRQSTPAQEQPDQDDSEDKYSSTHRIQLTLNGKPPKDPTRGYSFGTDPRLCDVVLGPSRNARGISGLHFYMTFNEDKELILKDVSTNGTSVSYSGQAGEEVELASHDTYQSAYDEQVIDFLEAGRTALPPLDVLGIYSHTTTAQPSQPLTPRRYPVYISERKLGSGSFGAVDKVIDASTGSSYARKQFYEPPWGKAQKRNKQQKEDWLKGICREIRIMRDNPHERIVQVVHFQEEPAPLLVMPYFPLGNLNDVHNECPIAVEETIVLLFQALQALDYLHPRGVAHRDLKPENILVESRLPFSIKVADFGLANDKPDLETCCGTRLYAAPEIYTGRKYTTSVDLWSLGVIVLQYMYGLPKHKNEYLMQQEWGLTWCHCIVRRANDWKSDGLTELLTIGMLRIRPEERLCAGACLKKGYDLRVFDHHYFDSGRSTPTRQTVLQGELRDGHSFATVILGPLWDPKEISNYDDNDRPESYGPQHTSGALKNCTIRASSVSGDSSDSSASNDEDGSRSQLGSFGTASEQSRGKILAPAELLSCSLGVQSTVDESRRYKRQRSPARGSAEHLSSRERTKRRQSDLRPTGRLVSCSYDLSDTSRAMYKAVLAFLTDLCLEDSESQNIDRDTCTRVEDLCKYIARLGITEMRLASTNLSDHVTVTAVSKSRDFILARLTASELMSSTADLAAHLLHMLQFQSPQLSSTSMAPVDDKSLQTTPIAQDNHSLSWTDDDMDRQMTEPRARQHGLTYPSALLDATNVSGCSIPLSPGS